MARTGIGFGLATRYALSFAQGILGLFAAGTIFYEAHQYFLKYYTNEWIGVQFSGVNGCAGEDLIANGDLIGGKTFCNKPENFVPWIEVYRHHPLAAALYYGTILLILVSIGIIWRLSQRRTEHPDPHAQQPHGANSDDIVI